MHQKIFVRLCVICLLAGLLPFVSMEAASFSFSISSSPSRDYRTTSNRPWGNLEAFKPGLKTQPLQQLPPAAPSMTTAVPAMPNSRYLGAAPGTGWYPAQGTGAATPASSSTPVVEIESSGGVFYEQQNIVYTVRVVSSDNLKTLNPVIPRVKGAILEQVDGPVASSRQSPRTGNREIVNEYHFKLTPLRPGEIVIPEIQFTGTHVANRQRNGAPGRPGSAGQNSFSIASERPQTLQVLPADPSVTPWLPLHDLKLRMQLSEDGPAREGVPVTLTLDLAARGALGTQLPSLEQQLKSSNFRAYRDSVSISGGVSRDGTKLLGSRKESYTIIPLQDGWIHLPGLQVAWWDVDRDKPMLAGLPGQDAGAIAAANRGAVPANGETDSFAVFFWAPLLIIMGLIIGYWLGAWARTRPLLRSVGARLSATGRRGLQHTVAAGRKLSPVPYMNKVRMAFALVMPKRVKLWLCIRCIESEDKPEAWCNQFRSRICDYIDVSKHAPITAIAEKIIEVQPNAEPARVRELVQSMDNAIYGSRPLDFVAWKKDFRYQLRPRLYRRRRSRPRRAGRELPALNPDTA